MVQNLMKIGWVEFLVALLLGAPVRLRSGKVLRIPYPQKYQRILDPKLFGFDFSKWQDVINFAKVLAYGAKFIILRCSYALTRDERFLVFIEDCLAHFPNVTSVYHYYDPVVSPTRQADKVIEILAPYKGRIKRVWGDFEFYWSGAYEGSAHWKVFAERIIAAGYEFGVYTRKTWWDSRVGNLASWFGQFPLWAAQYASTLTLIPAGWTKADIWQTGTPAIGTEVGAGSKEVDYNIMDDGFYKSEFGEIPDGGSAMEEYKIITAGLKIRTSPPVNGVLGPDAGKVMLRDDLIHISTKDIASGWLKIEKWIKATGGNVFPPEGVSWWCSGSPSFVQFVRVIDETPPPPPDPEPTDDEIKIVVNGEVKYHIIGKLQ